MSYKKGPQDDGQDLRHDYMAEGGSDRFQTPHQDNGEYQRLPENSNFSNNQQNSEMRPPAGMSGLGPARVVGKINGSKGLRSIHSKVHNTSSKAKNRQFQNPALDLDSPSNYESQQVPGIGNGLRDEAGYSQRSRGSRSGRKTKGKFAFGARTDRKSALNGAFGLSSNKKAMIFSNPSEYFDNRQGELIKENGHYQKELVNIEYPETPLCGADYAKRLKFEELKRTRLQAMCDWKQKDVKGVKKNHYIKEIQRKNDKILTVVDKNDLEKREVYTDRFPLLSIRNRINKVLILIQMVASAIITSPIFENISISVIILNSIIMMMDDPTRIEPDPFFENIENIFLALYSVEMVLKIVGMGFYFSENAYIKDGWNILDFVIVTSSLPTALMSAGEAKMNIYEIEMEGVQDDEGLSVGAFRAFRVLRPLKTISSVKGLKVLMNALFSAIPLLQDTMVILMFFFIILSIAGSNLMGGMLKSRCISVQTGKLIEDDLICGGTQSCPGGYFCGKTNENPNFGVTNFDNVSYSMLAVFQSVTLEGWSDVQVMLQEAYTYLIFLYFTLIVFVGAFFLLNLTLAVINSKFTEAHNEQQEKDRALLEQQTSKLDGDNDMDAALNQKDEMSIAQFITARIYAKKMIEFLRMRQEIKRIEHDRMMKIKEKQMKRQKTGRVVAGSEQGSNGTPSKSNGEAITIVKNNSQNSNQKPNKLSNGSKDGMGSNIIYEEDQEQISDHSDREQLDKDINNFLREANQNMVRQGYHTKTVDIPRHSQIGFNSGKKENQNVQIQKNHEMNGSGAPTMKGNIGPAKKNAYIEDDEIDQKQKRIFKKMAEEFDIDNVIPQAQQIATPDLVNHSKSIKSFDLSMEEYDIASHQSSRGGQRKPIGPSQTMVGRETMGIPGLEDLDESEQENGLITSDSDFEQAELAAGYNPQDQNSFSKKKTNIKKDVSKTFKKMLTSNHHRLTTPDEKMRHNASYGAESTQFNGSANMKSENAHEFDSQTQISEIESKFAKKRKSTQQSKYLMGKIYKNEDPIDENFLEDKYTKRNEIDTMLKTKKDDIRQLEEFISTKRPKDPFKDLDPLTQKVDISTGVDYKGTSQNDIFGQRIKEAETNNFLSQYRYIQLPKDMQAPVDPDFQDNGYVRSTFHPYQQKTVYQVYDDTSEDEKDPDAEEVSENEDELQAQVQPYETPTSISYEKMLNHTQILELARRSDIMITSTLSFNLITKDKRKMNQHYKKAIITRKDHKQELADYVDEKNAFLALDREHKYESNFSREKDSVMRINFLKSFINKTEFESKTLRDFKQDVVRMNTQLKKEKKKSKEIERQEKLRHEQNQRASEKRGLPKFDMEMSKKLLEGKFHDEEEDDGDPLTFQNDNKVVYTNEEDRIKSKLEKFAQAYNEIMESHEERHEDEIPDNIRKDFHVPKKMGVYEVDFQAIRKDDISYKRQTPLWSGQDILREKLDHDKSLWVVDHISSHRVWPYGPSGIFKRMRFVTRIKVKSPLFDNALTFAVLLNTITLSMVSATMTRELEQFLETANVWFTWIFIYEMFIKWYAVGIGKYFADTMNILDGGVVWLSIFEIVFQQVSSGSANLSAFRTIRMLRTFRVFRVARLLRALESMQTIMAVIAKSYKSFIYITVLMFLFVIIFSLLGMSLFGGSFNFVEGKPRGNYDSFQIAFVTIFQVLTMENWQSVLFDSMRCPTNPYFISVFYIMWIFLGNFILLNLFLAILLDSFLEEDEENDETSEEKEERLKRKRFLLEQKKKRLNKTKVFMSAMLDKRKSGLNKNKVDSEEDLEDLDVDEIKNIYKSQGIITKSQAEKQDQKLFVGIECESAFYLFPKENIFREYCYKSCKSTLWENTVLVLILLSSGKLGFDTYLNMFDEDSIVLVISALSDKIFNYCFIIEMVTKLIAIGFIMDEGSYLRESWNQLDFFIVMSSILDMSLDGFDLPALKILRMLRVLRPLRFITHNYELKMVVVALLDSVGGIFNVLIVVAVVYLIFAIMGVNFFMGTFVYCSIDPYTLHTQIQCLRAGGQWSTYDHNFDNVSNAMVTLFVVSSLEGWPDIMINSLDITKSGQGPQKEFNLMGMYFFIIFILIGSFFFLNFFIGVLFLKYNQAQAEENKGFTPKALGWMDIQRLILQAQPEYETTNVPQAEWRKWFHELVSSQKFDLAIMSCIMLNMIQMAFIMEGITQTMQSILDITNYMFTAVFIIEAICKIIAFGDTYLKLGWNKFDFFVVVSSILDLLLETLDTKSMEFLTVAPQLARVMRVLRVTRIIKLAGKQEGLQAIIQTIVFSLPSLGNVVILLGLIYFMFTIMGWFVFQEILEGDVISELKNYTTFVNGFLLVFALSTGEDWNKVMFDCTRSKADGCIAGINCGSNFAYLYFMLLVLVCSHVMLNLFILVIIQQFEKYYLPKENMITKFKNDLACFMKVWKELTQDRYRCHKIKENQLTRFFRRLGDFGDKDNSLGFSEEYFNDGELKKQVLKMAINSDMGYIYFNELLYRCMRKKYGNMKINKRMQIFELRTQFQIFLITRKKQSKSKAVDNQEIYDSIIRKENQVNPFLTVMNFKISYKTWLKTARQNLRKKAKENSSVAENTTLVEEDPKKFMVEIDYEIIVETTSEEDSQDEKQALSSLGNMKADSESKHGSSVDLRAMIKEKKKKDQLKLFEKKMTQKFKSLNTSMKKQPTLKSMKGPKSVALEKSDLGDLKIPPTTEKKD